MTLLLLVEDHEEIWDFLSPRLKRRDYDVTVATDRRAWTRLGRSGPTSSCST